MPEVSLIPPASTSVVNPTAPGAASNGTTTALTEGVDTVTLSGAAKTGFRQRVWNLVPKALQGKLSGIWKALDKIPGAAKYPWLKVSVLIEGAINTFTAAQDTMEGYQKTEGGLFSKVVGGVQSGIKSFFKSSIGSAVSLGLSIAIPTLLKIPIMGPWGIIAGIAGNLVLGGPIRRFLDKFLPTHSKPEPAEGSDDPYQKLGLPPERNEIVNEIDRVWKSREYDPGARSNGPNPWLSGMPVREQN